MYNDKIFIFSANFLNQHDQHSFRYIHVFDNIFDLSVEEIVFEFFLSRCQMQKQKYISKNI